jgi:hypothetical protein
MERVDSSGAGSPLGSDLSVADAVSSPANGLAPLADSQLLRLTLASVAAFHFWAAEDRVPPRMLRSPSVS